jgi:hypothetical protein
LEMRHAGVLGLCVRIQAGGPSEYMANTTVIENDQSRGSANPSKKICRIVSRSQPGHELYAKAVDLQSGPEPYP